MTWTGPLSPRIKVLIERHKSSGDNERRRLGAGSQFQVRHFPDRPPRRPRREDIPNDDECERLLRSWSDGHGRNAGARRTTEVEDRCARNDERSRRIRTQRDLDVGLGIQSSNGERWRDADRSGSKMNYSPRGTLEVAGYEPTYPQQSTGNSGLAPREADPVPTSPSIYPSTDDEVDSPSLPKYYTSQVSTIRGSSAIYASPEPIQTSPPPQPEQNRCPLCTVAIPPTHHLCKFCEREFRMSTSVFTSSRHSADVRPLPPLPRDTDHVAHHYHSGHSSSTTSGTNTSSGTDGSSVFHTPPTSRNSENAAFASSPLRIQTSALERSTSGGGGGGGGGGGVHSRFQLQRACAAEIIPAKENLEERTEAETYTDADDGGDENSLYDGEWAEYYFDEDNFRGWNGHGAGTVSDKSLRRKLRVTEGDAASVGAVLQAPPRSWI